MFKNKDAGLVTLRDSAAVDSALMSVDGKTILQRFHLKSDVIEYDLPARHLSVPVPGQMLVENRADPRDEQARQAKRAKAKEGAKEGAEDDPAASAMNDGATAFQWARRLEFEESAGRAKMEGSVVVNHQPDDKGEAPVRVDADELIAEFVPETAVADAKKGPDQPKERVAAGAETKGAAPSMARLRVKSFSAVGNILISREGAELSAGRVDYDPATEWVVARGSGRTPAVFTHPSGNGSATAEELWLNTKTWQVKVIDVSTRAGGPTH